MAQYAFEESGTQESYTQTFDAGSIGSFQYFNQSNRSGVFYTESPIVEDNESAQYVEGQDYEWYSENGSLEITSQTLANTTNNTIDYSLTVPSQQQRQTAGFVATLLKGAKWIPLVLIVGLLVIVLGVFGGLA